MNVFALTICILCYYFAIYLLNGFYPNTLVDINSFVSFVDTARCLGCVSLD